MIRSTFVSLLVALLCGSLLGVARAQEDGMPQIEFDDSAPAYPLHRLNIVPEAVNKNGQKVRPLGEVTPGTSFKFELKVLLDGERVMSGDWTVDVNGYDSSGVPLMSARVDGSKEDESHEVAWKLEDDSLPAGALKFVFTLTDEAGTLPLDPLVYVLNVPMVASDISVSTNTASIGDAVVLTMVPAVFSDSTTIQALDASYASQRRFWVDAKSASGKMRLASAEGQPGEEIDGTVEYTFELEVQPLLDFIGEVHLSFRYQQANGPPVELDAYDSLNEEIIEDTSDLLVVNVEADLELVVETEPSSNSLQYGAPVEWAVLVQDKKSSQYVAAGQGAANVYLTLEHPGHGGATFQSVERVATLGQNADELPTFTIGWVVDPNAVRGPGTMSLVARNADSKTLALTLDGAAVRRDVTIGGDIEVASVEESEFQDGEPETIGVVVVEFELTCNDVALGGAKLRGTVRRGGEVVLDNLPITELDGEYHVSFESRVKNMPSGSYTIDIYRETDRVRATQEAESRRVPVSEVAVKEFLSIAFDVQVPMRRMLPFQTTFYALLALVAVLLNIHRASPKMAKQ